MAKNNSTIRLRAGDRELSVSFSSRDWKLLDRRYISGVEEFNVAFGFSGSSVEAGLERGIVRIEPRLRLLSSARALWEKLEPQLDLLDDDYLCEPEIALMPGAKARSGLTGIRIGEQMLVIEAPPAQCALWIHEWQPDGSAPLRFVRDLRRTESIESDNYGRIAIRRRSRRSAWREALPQIIAFLDAETNDAVEVFNTHR